MLTSVERLLFVRGVPIFQELRDDFLVRVASVMDELSFPSDHTIVTQGEEGRSLYTLWCPVPCGFTLAIATWLI